MTWRTRLQQEEYARELLCSGWRHVQSLGCAKDRKPSDALLRQAAANGDVWAQYFLGLYATDAKLSFQYFTQAAKQGNPFAQYALGMLYLQTGRDQHSAAQAAEWFKKSAAQIGWGSAELQNL